MLHGVREWLEVGKHHWTWTRSYLYTFLYCPGMRTGPLKEYVKELNYIHIRNSRASGWSVARKSSERHSGVPSIHPSVHTAPVLTRLSITMTMTAEVSFIKKVWEGNCCSSDASKCLITGPQKISAAVCTDCHGACTPAGRIPDNGTIGSLEPLQVGTSTSTGCCRHRCWNWGMEYRKTRARCSVPYD